MFKHLYFIHINFSFSWTNQVIYFVIYNKRVPLNFNKPFNINYFKGQAYQFITFILYICLLKQSNISIDMIIVYIKNCEE